ncbi:MAG: leucyl-tRNA synthetase [Parcubacteria group bacterium Gr01-1014_24]|nr:MAG: leucyl-tRNA synthetase [Parcubacteria group bacterium Gr01-1014_24]
MKSYDHKKIERKWQSIWEKKKIYYAKSPSSRAKLATGRLKNKKFYSLIEFPYPSGDGLHVGHPRPYIGMDVISRKKRMEGYNVLYPIGWDAFGLPTENYAIKTGKDPRVVTKQNSDTFRRQIKSLGISFDWSREINTTDPKYYKWTQWIFLQFLKKGLAYKAKMTINWCPSCKIGLANEEVVNGSCERCGTAVEKREKEQWMLAITKYADRLGRDLDEVDYLPQIKLGQRNWIGRSEGIMYKQKIKDLKITVEAYDSIPQTFMAQTFCVIAPEHPLVKKLIAETKYEKPVLSFIEKFNRRKIKSGFKTENEIEGIFTGRYIDNPFGTGDLPIWVATFVIADYGTGIVNASAHDERDFAFAKKYNIPLRNVTEPLFVNTNGADVFQNDKPFAEREAVSLIIKHWSENKYLGLKSKNVHWAIFLTGGVEKGENPEDAAIREITEETGYVNFKLIKKVGRSHAKFYHVQKKENVFAHFTSFYFELLSGEQKKTSEEEKNKHDLVWLAPEAVENFLTPEGQKREWNVLQGTEQAIVKNGILTEPAEFKGREWSEVREDIINYIVKKGWGKKQTNYKLRDWVFSRQRYWGEPIPVINCPACAKAMAGKENSGWIPVPEKNLPVELPKVKNYQPTDSGESPLANIAKWVNVKCPKCKGKARRETDTMPNWAGSSWYYLRYTDPKNNKEFASQKNLKYWLGNDPARGGVNWYNGGNEHTTLHLLYSRFWHKFLFDLGLVPTNEPYMKRTSHGLILAEGGEKMSKSKGNVINPDDIVKIYGADTLRLYEMFMGPFDQAIAWSQEAIIGPSRFLERIWRLGQRMASSDASAQDFLLRNVNHSQKHTALALKRLLHKTIKKVSEDIEEMHFNTAISAMMILSTEMEKAEHVLPQDYKKFLQILSPFAPHITEELYAQINADFTQKNADKIQRQSVSSQRKSAGSSIHLSQWPKWDENLIKDEEVKIVVQINGKVRAEITISADEKEEDVKKKALEDKAVLKYTKGKDIKRTIYVKNRLINIVF